jgi:hypothetical protein
MKKKKWIIYGLIPFVVLFVSALIFLGRYTDRLVDPYVRSLLEHTKPMRHTIEYKNIRINLLQRYIRVEEVSMYPDTSITKDDSRLEIDVKNILLTGFSIRQMIFNKSLIIDELVIENPIVKLTLKPKEEDGVKEHGVKKLPKEGSQLLSQIQLNRIIFSGGSFQLIRDNVVVAESPGINLLAQDISIIENTNNEPIGFTYGEVLLDLSDIALRSETGLYDMNLAGFAFSKSDSTIILRGFHMIPKYDKKEFSGKLDFQNDRFDVHIGEIEIGNIGIKNYLAGGPFEISSILIDSLNADIYRDKNVAFNFDRFPLFYNESFLKIPFPISIDTVAITNSKIQYGEQEVGHPVAGTIILENFSLQSYNLTNQIADDTIDNIIQLNVQASVMGEGSINLEMMLPLEGNLHDFECSGSVGAMELSQLNDMLEPSIKMKLKKGRLDRMTFSFKASDMASRGWMEFLYKDLDVELMKKDPEKEWGFVSNVANWVALSNNPAHGKELKIVEISIERDKNKGIINYVWKTLQSGIVRTVLPIKKYQVNRKNHEKEKDKRKHSRDRGENKNK